jgi:hypothetical protein
MAHPFVPDSGKRRLVFGALTRANALFGLGATALRTCSRVGARREQM